MIISDCINTHINVNMSSIYTLIIVSNHISKVTTNLKSTFYQDKKMQDIMKNIIK